MSEATPTDFGVAIVCSKGHDAHELTIRVQTIVTTSSGDRVLGTTRQAGKDAPPGWPIAPLEGIPSDRQRARYELFCDVKGCRRSYVFTVEKLLSATEKAVKARKGVLDVNSI